MQLNFIRLLVHNQEEALRFYTEVLEFNKMADIPMGEFRWLTVSSPGGIPGVELVLEPLTFPPAEEYQKALFNAGLPMIAITTTDIQRDYQKMVGRGIVFRGKPQQFGPINSVLFEDTCGNLINLVQPLIKPE